MSDAKFRNENTFSVAFAKAFIAAAKSCGSPVTEKMVSVMEQLQKMITTNRDEIELVELFQFLSDICACSDKPVVLMIDEVDSATNNQVFLDFLAQLRGYYIDRDRTPTFRSVILAGVYDIKNLKHKIRSDAEHKNNSPWNIAANFKVDMSFDTADIAGMLRDYENDHQSGMDIQELAQLIYDYTSGYPFLVSKICKILDEDILGTKDFSDYHSVWTKAGFLDAIKILLAEKNTLFESLVNKLTDYPELREVVYAILFDGKEVPYNSLNKSIEIAEMFGFVKNEHNKVAISNRIFETLLYNLFLSEEVIGSQMYDSALQSKNQFIINGHLNMTMVLERFVQTFDDLYGDKNEKFLEDVGRKYFMLFLKPIINGTGNSYIEAQTRNMRRTDIIVDYRGEQFIVELKIWGGSQYHADGEQQISEYLDFYHIKKGYMLTFNFNKNKDIGVKEVVYGDKILVEAVV
jgi:hypothetical protein